MNAELKFAKCIKLLESGNWKKGMKLYHARYANDRISTTKVSFPDLPIPFIQQGNINAFKGKSVLVINEQGFGDEFMFFRGIHYLMEVAKSIAYMAYPETIELLKKNAPEQIQFFTQRSFDEDYLSQFDCWTTSGTLFNILSKNEPIPMKYFLSSSDSQIIEKGSIGLCCFANSKSPTGNDRSVDPELLKEMLDGDIRSLDVGIDVPEWIVPCPEFKDFHDTCKYIESLCNVITVDTSIAHLAGSMGKNTILIIKDHFDWRWKYSSNGISLLYPTVKIVHLKDLQK